MFEGEELTFEYKGQPYRITFASEDDAYRHVMAVNAGVRQLSERSMINGAIKAAIEQHETQFSVNGYNLIVKEQNGEI